MGKNAFYRLKAPAELMELFRQAAREVPEAGQDGVETCKTNPSPLLSQASMPFECPAGDASLAMGLL